MSESYEQILLDDDACSVDARDWPCEVCGGRCGGFSDLHYCSTECAIEGETKTTPSGFKWAKIPISHGHHEYHIEGPDGRTLELCDWLDGEAFEIELVLKGIGATP